jgi:hypothetical protein
VSKQLQVSLSRFGLAAVLAFAIPVALAVLTSYRDSHDWLGAAIAGLVSAAGVLGIGAYVGQQDAGRAKAIRQGDFTQLNEADPGYEAALTHLATDPSKANPIP